MLLMFPKPKFAVILFGVWMSLNEYLEHTCMCWQCWRKSLDVKKLDYPPHGKCVLIFLGKQKSTAGMIVEVSLRKGAWPPYLSRTNFYFIILLVWREDYCIIKKQKIQVPYSYYSTLPKSFIHFGCIFIFLASQRCKVESVQSCNVPNE